MWLYVPTSTSFPSAPEAEDSISASNWQFQVLERSAWWRGKSSPSRTWFQRWKRVSWLRHLYGAMPEPSTAERGVAAWTASLAASRASRIRSPEGSAEATTSATCGVPPAASSCSRGRGLSLSRTSPGCSRLGMTKSLAPKGYGETYRSWVLRLRQDCLRRQKLARRTKGSASSSSAWPTATTRDWRSDASNLTDEELYGTKGRPLARVAANWSSPRPTSGEKGGPNQSFGAGGTPLPAQASQWATPTAKHEPRGSGNRLNPKGGGGCLASDAMDFSRLDLQTSRHGEPPSKERRSLNPRFVAWLMGWPQPASTGFGFSETASYHYRPLMRSALLRLDLPETDQPAQLALFG